MKRSLVAFLPLALWAAAVLVVGSRESLPLPDLPRYADKVGHFVMYGVGGALAAWAGRIRGPVAGWTGVMLVILVGALDELHQSTLPARDGSAWDWAADVTGALVFFAITAAILRRS